LNTEVRFTVSGTTQSQKEWLTQGGSKMKVVKLVLFALAIGCLTVQSAMGAEPFLRGKSPKEQEAILSKMSGYPSMKLALKLGLATIRGKSISIQSPKTPGPIKLLADRPVGQNPFITENEPTLAAKPNSTTILVAGSHLIGHPSGKCGAFRSSDGGNTWLGPVLLPLLPIAGDFCSDPVMRWAPDGTKVYAAYMSIRGDDSSSDIVVSKSINNGATWSPPVRALAGSATRFMDKPWLGTHPVSSVANVYVTGTAFFSSGAVEIRFTRSINSGGAFGAPLILAAESATSPVALQGSNVTGGNGTDVLACWYNSETDGWGPGGGGRFFDVRCKASTNGGVAFGGEIVAVNNAFNELPFWLGPAAAYHRWWGGMFPRLVITTDGVAHMVFTSDPVLGSATPRDGVIIYTRATRGSAGPIYANWGRPAQISSTENAAQGYPNIAAKQVSEGNVVVVAWEDHRLSSSGDNNLYDIFSDQTNPSFGTDWRISDLSSLSQFTFIGDYTESSANRIPSDRVVHTIWTDRSDRFSVTDFEQNVYEDKIPVP
jgi:hypothetical protein